MRVVAFRRLKHTPNRGTNHEELIVEFAYTDLHPKRYHQEAQGYEVVYETKFLIELAKNDQLIEEYDNYIKGIRSSELRCEQQKLVRLKERLKEEHLKVDSNV